MTLLSLGGQGLAQQVADHAGVSAELRLPGLDGAVHALSEWAGKVIVLNFWATWCPPCRTEVPLLMNAQRRFAAQGLQVVSVGLDEARKLRNFARTLNLNYPVLLAEASQQGPLLAQWGDRSHVLPFTVVIAQDGRIHYRREGPLDEEALEVYVLPLLADGREGAAAHP